MASILVFANVNSSLKNIGDTFKHDGHVTHVVHSADQLFQTILTATYDIIIFDATMPWQINMIVLKRLPTLISISKNRLFFIGKRPEQATDNILQILGLSLENVLEYIDMQLVQKIISPKNDQPNSLNTTRKETNQSDEPHQSTLKMTRPSISQSSDSVSYQNTEDIPVSKSSLIQKIAVKQQSKDYFNQKDELPTAELETAPIKQKDIEIAKEKQILEDYQQSEQEEQGQQSEQEEQGKKKFPLQGKLSETPLAHVLLFLARSKSTGYLMLDGVDGICTITYKEGDIVGAHSQTGQFSLGIFLIQTGRIKAQDLQMLSQKGSATLQNIIENKLLSPHEVSSILKDQAEYILQTLIPLNQGVYRWMDQPSQKIVAHKLGIHLRRTIIDAYKAQATHFVANELSNIKPSFDAKQWENLAAWGLLPYELRLLHHMTGEHTIQEAIEFFSAGNLERQKELVGLVQTFSVFGLFAPFLQKPSSENSSKKQNKDELSTSSSVDKVKFKGKEESIQNEIQTSIEKQTKPSDPNLENNQDKLKKEPRFPTVETAVKQEKVDKKPTTDWEAQKIKLKEECSRLEKSNYFEMLNLTNQSSTADVKSRFILLSKQYHPDRVYGAPDDIKELYQNIFRMIQEANTTLSDPKKREEYEKNKNKAKDKDDGIDAKSLVQAEISFTEGELFLKNKNYQKAYEHFSKAVELNKFADEYKLYLSWSLFLIDPDKNAESTRAQIYEIVKNNQKMAQGLYFLGYILKTQGELEKAEGVFRKVVSINAQHIDAMRELRLINMRKNDKNYSSKPSSTANKNQSGAKKSIFDIFKRS